MVDFGTQKKIGIAVLSRLDFHWFVLNKKIKAQVARLATRKL
jgi:hypothetical protein